MALFTELLVFVVILNLKVLLSASILKNIDLNKFNGDLILNESPIKAFNELDIKHKLKFLWNLIRVAHLQVEEEEYLQINDNKNQYRNTSDSVQDESLQELEEEPTISKNLFEISSEISSTSSSLAYKTDGDSTEYQSKEIFFGNTEIICEQPVKEVSSDEYVVDGPKYEETIPCRVNRTKQEVDNIYTTLNKFKTIHSNLDLHHRTLHEENAQEPDSSLYHTMPMGIEHSNTTATEHIAESIADIEKEKTNDEDERSDQTPSIVLEPNNTHEINLTANANKNLAHLSTEKEIKNTDGVSIQKNQRRKNSYEKLIETTTETYDVNNWNYKTSHGSELNDVKKVNNTINDTDDLHVNVTSKPNKEKYGATHTTYEINDVIEPKNDINSHIKLNDDENQPNNEIKVAKEINNETINVKKSSNERDYVILPDHETNQGPNANESILKTSVNQSDDPRNPIAINIKSFQISIDNLVLSL